jgi:hypothetical protein
MKYDDTKRQFIFLIYLYLFIMVNCELLGVIQLNRHGARAGSDDFKNLNYFNYYGTTNNHLTINGYRQQELLGRWIAERYIHFDFNLLNKDYPSNNEEESQILIRSSPSERTIFSAIAFLKGLYPNSLIETKFMSPEEKIRIDDTPPISGFSLRKSIPKIPIHIADPDHDVLFKPLSCKLDKDDQLTLKDMLDKEVLFNLTMSEIKESVDDIRDQFKSAFEDKSEEEVYSKSFIQKLNHFIIPIQYHFKNTFFKIKKETNLLLNKIQISKWYAQRMVHSETLKYAYSGFFDEWLTYLGKFSDPEKSKLKYVVYSAHDDNLITLISALLTKEKLLSMMKDIENNYNILQPEFASSFLIELHSLRTNLKSKKKYIRIIYNGNILRDGLNSSLKYNQEIDGIPFEIFRNFLINGINPNYKNLYCARKIEEA